MEALKIIIAGVIVFIMGLPVVILFDKWKKEMDKEDENK